MPRVVLDTNVVVSALLFGGIPATILRLVRDDECQAVTSPALLDELHRVLIVKFEYPTRVADATLKRWRAVNAVVTPPLELRIIAADPSDNRVLECALAGEADAIVSGGSVLARPEDVPQHPHRRAARVPRGLAPAPPIIRYPSFLKSSAASQDQGGGQGLVQAP